MASSVEHKVRSMVLKCKLSVSADIEKDEIFIRNVFQELNGLMAAVCNKHNGLVRHQECHPIVDVWPIAERTLFKLHEAIG